MRAKRSTAKAARKSGRPNVSKEELLRYIQQTSDRSANLRRILEDFDTTPIARKQIKDTLNQLVKEGTLTRHKGNRYEARAGDLIEGTIILHREGYAFVVPKEKVEGLNSDIFIPSALTGSAMNGDKVKVEITNRKPGGRAEGRVVNVTERARETVVGQLRWDGQVFFVAPTDQKLPAKIVIPDDVSEHKDKIVEVHLTRFPSATYWPAGKIVSVIGFLDDPGVETNVIIKKFGLPLSFPKEVETETNALPNHVTEKDFMGRDDFRRRKTITIDPSTARDFDDAIDVEILHDGTFQVGVHIADVSHFVPMDSATDAEARSRGTSVYFPDRVVPMLPGKISNELCSLNPRADRLAVSVILHLSRSGQVRDYSFHKSIIHSKERMSYDDVQKILDGDVVALHKYARVEQLIHNLAGVAQVLLERRRRRGAIDFDLPEATLTYDEQGIVEGIFKSVRLFSHRIVEEFMILANEVVAQHLEEADVTSIYRVHEPPDPAKIEEFSNIAEGFGLKFRAHRIEPSEFQKFIESIEGRPEERMLSYLMLRSFKQAMYSTENVGHFGLASDCYTHFTSPIRRYPDLIVHRILKATIVRRPEQSPSYTQLQTIATEASERERLADQAERELIEWKKMVLLERHLGKMFEAIIIGVWKDGFSIELIDHFIEGFVAVSDIPDDYFQLDSSNRALVGRRSGRRFRLGDRLPVRVTRVDKLLRRAYFLPVLAAFGSTR
jgi:ribonuclease R